MKIVLGGTFDKLHKGHKALLWKAFTLARNSNGDVTIGLSSDKFAISRKSHPVTNYNTRRNNLESYIGNYFFDVPYNIEELNDYYGSAATDYFDVLVVGYDTNGDLINEVRKQKGLIPLTIVKIDPVLYADGKPYSTSRIYSGEIY